MNRAFRLFAIASLLATAALILGGWPATAQPVPDAGINEVTAIEPQPGLDEEIPPPPDPDQPDEEVPDPEHPGDDAPDEIKDQDPCPTHGPCGEDEDKDDEGSDEDDDIDKPTRIDAGTGTSDDDLALTWLLASGALISATGAAFAVLRRGRAKA